MFARFSNPKFNAFMFNENAPESDSSRSGVFTTVSASAKARTTVLATSKSFTVIGGDEGKPFIEVGG